MKASNVSPFISPGPAIGDKTLGIISLKRDLQVPMLLRAPNPSNPTDEITNTRFGSFPHSTLLNVPWGSQIVASKVETGESRRGRKRKRPEGQEDTKSEERVIPVPAFEAASSGFAHLLAPTPELWTLSLPHRTQVVYTPDYSFILQRLRVKPGDTIIEAGAGSGSFTHAAARAVFDGRHSAFQNGSDKSMQSSKKQDRIGKVCSYEYHEPRFVQLQKEIEEHGLESTVTVTHRDVYEGGFCLDNGDSPEADAVFLDLPAPWTALKHLSREPSLPDLPSPLNPRKTTRICSFSPCIEQVEQTINAMRELGWIEIHMYEMQHRRIDVRRELTSLNYEGLRGVNATAASVEEAVHALKKYNQPKNGVVLESKQSRLGRIKEEDKDRKVWREGKMVHRSEPEIKTHTSFLVFAMLPRAWSEADEEMCRKKWSLKGISQEKAPDTSQSDEGRSDNKPLVSHDTGLADALVAVS